MHDGVDRGKKKKFCKIRYLRILHPYSVRLHEAPGERNFASLGPLMKRKRQDLVQIVS